MTNPSLIERILGEQAEMTEAGNPAKTLAISRRELERLCSDLGVGMPLAGLDEFLGMRVLILPDFALIDQSGATHTR